MSKPLPALRPLPASLVLVCSGLGALVLIAVVTFALVPLMIGLGVVAALVVSALFFAWAGLEGMAALERWMENDPRFRQ
ncbi:MAG: glypican [Prochlorococcaceae cyanobacterium]